MVEKYFIVGNKKVSLESIDDVVVLKYKKTLSDTSAIFMIASNPEVKEIEIRNVKTYPAKYNISSQS